tara:strand:- start:3918 stop:4664 length:747 start_codon:yes stop_codon:yes gene_type:complete
METGKTTRYFKYAIGEIFLVVIGILIALQINNWKQQHKDRNIEKTVYKTLLEDLALDTLDMTFNIAVNKKIIKAEEGLLALMNGEKIDSIDLKNAIGNPLILEFHESGFERITNVNTEVISNNNLKNKITRHNDFYYPAIKKFEDDYMTSCYDRKLKFLQHHFIIDSKSNEVQVIDISTKNYLPTKLIRKNYTIKDKRTLKKDEPLKVILSESSFFRSTLLSFYEDLFNQNRELIKDIKLELAKLENR